MTDKPRELSEEEVRELDEITQNGTAFSYKGESTRKMVADLIATIEAKDKEIENLKISLRGIESTHAEFVDDMVKTQSSLSRLMEAVEDFENCGHLGESCTCGIDNLKHILEEIRKGG